MFLGYNTESVWWKHVLAGTPKFLSAVITFILIKKTLSNWKLTHIQTGECRHNYWLLHTDHVLVLPTLTNTIIKHLHSSHSPQLKNVQMACMKWLALLLVLYWSFISLIRWYNPDSSIYGQCSMTNTVRMKHKSVPIIRKHFYLIYLVNCQHISFVFIICSWWDFREKYF